MALRRVISLRSGRPHLATLLSVATVVLSLFGVSLGAEEQRVGSRPDILLITVDTLRRDALGWIGGHDRTPYLDSLARSGFRFPLAVSPAPVTQPAHASILSGLLPRHHGVRDNGQVLGRGHRLLPETLASEGWLTAAFVSGFPVTAAFGFDRGFGHFDEDFEAGKLGGVERSASATTSAALAWAQEQKGPRFVWIHYFDPHDPYEPDPSMVAPGPHGAYYGEVVAVDRAIDRLVSSWPASAAPLVVFTADHGESLGEHGEATHGFFIYDSTIAVPMVVSWPGRIERGQSDAPVRLVDVVATLHDLLDLPPSSPTDGISFRPLLRGEEQAIPPALIESIRPWASFGWSPLSALRTSEWKLVEAPRSELYRLSDDPGERDNLVVEQRKVAHQLATTLKELRAVRASPSVAVPDDMQAKLEALGYLGAGTAAPERARDLADPKDRIGVWNDLSRALSELESGRAGRALELFDAVLEVEPESPFAWARSGAAALAAGYPGEAVRRLEKATTLRPTDIESHILLARSLAAAGELNASIEEWRLTVLARPRQADIWEGLAISLGRSGRGPEAIEALARCIELAPTPTRLAQLAFVEYAENRVEAAAAHLGRSAGSWTGGAFPYSPSLALMLLESGRKKEAIGWLEGSQREDADYARAQVALARAELGDGDPAAARRALDEALSVDPELRSVLKDDPPLAGLLVEPRAEHEP